jgi:hypothetical protein
VGVSGRSKQAALLGREFLGASALAATKYRDGLHPTATFPFQISIAAMHLQFFISLFFLMNQAAEGTCCTSSRIVV